MSDSTHLAETNRKTSRLRICFCVLAFFQQTPQALDIAAIKAEGQTRRLLRSFPARYNYVSVFYGRFAPVFSVFGQFPSPIYPIPGSSFRPASAAG